MVASLHGIAFEAMVMMDQQPADTESRISELGRRATELKQAGEIDAAVANLREAKALMGISTINHTPENWCRLALYLQQANRFAEAKAELEALLVELPLLANRYSKIDDPNVGPVKQKRAYQALILKDYAKVYKAKMSLIEQRESKRKAV
jgi:tetratricopeptide (TPR) repeat protein